MATGPGSTWRANLNNPRYLMGMLNSQPASPAKSIALAYVRAAAGGGKIVQPDPPSPQNQTMGLGRSQIQELLNVKMMAEALAKTVTPETKAQNPELWYRLEASLGLNGYHNPVPALHDSESFGG